jgi:hypothetical protein
MNITFLSLLLQFYYRCDVFILRIEKHRFTFLDKICFDKELLTFFLTLL